MSGNIELKLVTSIKRLLLRKYLWRGTLFAVIGAAIFFVTGLFLPSSFMAKWGWLVVIVALGLVTYGVYPYKSLMRKDLDPDILFVANDGMLRYIANGRMVFTRPLTEVEGVSYYENGSGYGMELKFRGEDWKEEKLPYFTEKACGQMGEFLNRLNSKG